MTGCPAFFFEGKLSFLGPLSSLVHSASRHPLFPYVVLLLGIIGVFVVVLGAVSVSRVVFRVFFRRGKSVSRMSGNGSWAVVTGASDGIGREFATQLAARHFNVLLVARTASKLQAVASEISSQSAKVQVTTHCIDFASASDADYRSLESALGKLKISVLVNNVGTNHDIPTPFASESPAVLDAIVTVNALSITRITRIVLPSMILAKRGLILNVGSFAGLVPTPFLAVYSATKSFLRTWSIALNAELANSGVSVEHLSTYFVVSAMSRIKRPSWLVPSAKAYVKSALDNTGIVLNTPYYSHRIAEYLISLVPSSLLLSYNTSLHKSIRKRALRKRERDAKKL